MVVAALALFLALPILPRPPSPAITPVSYYEYDHGYHPIDNYRCCPNGSYGTADGFCQWPRSGGGGGAGLLISFILIGLIIAWACASNSKAKPPELDLPDGDIDTEALLADLEARAPQNLTPVEKVEWAAREGARIIAEAGRKKP